MWQKMHINRCFRWKRIERIGELFMAMFDYQRVNMRDFGITHNFRITSLNQENMWIIWLLIAQYVHIMYIYICNQTLRLNQPQHGDIIREVIIWYYVQIWEGRYREKHIPLWIGPKSWWTLKNWAGICEIERRFGNLSKPCTPGEHQNSW
jgi:hypothetical protein